MSIYQKLAQARVKLQEKGLKKTGKNRNFSYFELKDFLPSVNEIFNELKMCSVVSYNNDLATLTIYDGEKDEKIVITSPMVQEALPSGNDIQNLGAIQTYQRRYLYLTALEIAENDAVDCLDTSDQHPAPSTNATPSDKFKELINERLNRCQTKEELTALYGKLEVWVKEKHPEYLDEFSLIFNDKILSFQ